MNIVMVQLSNVGKLCLVAVIVLFCFVIVVSPVDGETTSEEAIAAIAEAEENLRVAYSSVLEAEKAGANVSGLLVKLNSAVDFVDSANGFYERGDFAGAVQNATMSSQLSEQVMVEAPSFRRLAVSDAAWRFGWTVFGSVVGAIVIGCCGFLGWGAFRKRYLRKMLKLKPEVSVDES